ncbi:MAG: hypothetical protein SCALA702_02380 [Melioribacteraceae bacterium]|nr:MAG: hypothetical protein SCALA702_02380 [Melioribacteraceae bacterium]
MYDWLYAMRKFTVIISVWLVLGFQFGEIIENEIISDVFIEIAGSPAIYITKYLPLMSDVELVNQINNYSNSEFAKLDSHHYPFKYSKLLKETGGEQAKLIHFRKLFDEFYKEKIDELIIANNLVFRTSEVLFSIDASEEKTSSALLEYEEQSGYKTGETASLQNNLNVGVYQLLKDDSSYHDTKWKNKSILELGRVQFSQFKFNQDSTRAVFYIRYNKDRKVGWEKRVEVSKSGSWKVEKQEITSIN